jgi:hypothetical protein
LIVGDGKLIHLLILIENTAELSGRVTRTVVHPAVDDQTESQGQDSIVVHFHGVFSQFPKDEDEVLRSFTVLEGQLPPTAAVRIIIHQDGYPMVHLLLRPSNELNRIV